MAKIFTAFFNGIDDPNDIYGLPCFFDGFLQGLIDNGNDVLAFQYKTFFMDFSKHNTLLSAKIEEIKKFNPDLIILFNNSFCDLTNDFDCPIIIYEVDSPLYYKNRESLLKNRDRYKFFVPQTDTMKYLREEWKIKEKNILYTPFFSSVQAVNLPFKTNISFIGTKFTQGTVPFFTNCFMLDSPTEAEIEKMKELISYFEKHPFAKKQELIDTLKIKSELVKKYSDPSTLIWQLSDIRRVRTLSAVADLGLSLYGTQNWAIDVPFAPELTLSYHKKLVYSLKHNQDIYNSSKIGININHLQAKSGFAWRVCDIMASNACLVTEYKPDFKKLFPDIPIPFFTNHFEAREQCQKLLKNENLRRDIVSACQNVINAKYRFEHLLHTIEDYLNINLRVDKVGSISYLEIPKFNLPPKIRCSFKNKIRLKIYKGLRKKLEQKGLI